MSGTDVPRPSAVPVVLLPGMLCSGLLWRAQTERLERLTEVRTVTLTGDSIEAMADDVLSLPCPRFALAGLSLGGIVAMAVARRAPERITRLALLSTSARPPRPEQRAGWDAMAQRTKAGEFDRITPESLLPHLLHPAHAGDPVLRGTVLEMADRTGPDVFLRQLAAQHSRTDLRPGLREVRCPTLVVAGEDDPLAPLAAHREIADAVAGARLETLPATGHLTPLERPAEVTELLVRWLTDEAMGIRDAGC
ncbi:alpha/beta hydrolase [Streptomyces castrisilvae]|uniref:Alpha/beta hydrolase n=1 Tax=Streptomyces castrisilvae TaxID=3033811 RepID=A0ABY9HL03_9ACTN|nr:alpha/beta hydrolase [Streptomyces sp. Mut1]WLQ35192.1 alpha/beta hydrolase [Streptomyces sp. Mut1]